MFAPAATAFRRSAPLWALCLAVAACGQAATKGSGTGAQDVAINFPDLLSGGDGDLGGHDGSSDSVGPDSGSDANPIGDASEVDGSSDTAQTNCEFPANPLPGAPGSACTTSDQCDSNACVDGPSGKICTSACISCCPTGFKCAPFQSGGGGDTLQVCMPKWNALCRPCNTDAECAKLGSDSLCVAYAVGGSFCGGGCATDADCPGDYKCLNSQGEKGAGKQCVRTGSACSCSPQAIADGAQTTCKITNSSGTCASVRKCTLAGLDACTAATPATETCGDGIDNDCNGLTDENGAKGCTQVWPDADGDGDGKLGSASLCECTPSGLYTATTATDCDDANKAINGKAPEICDGIDNNCNGLTDEGCDKDGDGWCDINMLVVGDPLVCKKGVKDCDDTNAAVNPGMQEVCGNGIDDNCDGLTDSGPNVSGCVPFYADNDGDGYGSGDPVCQCGATGVYTATKTGDCADNDPKVNPGEKELCGNQKDDDCNGLTDEANAVGCTNYYVDLDGDGFGTATPTCLCAPNGFDSALKSGDCDDSAVAINPAATETCNGVDDNCNGLTDEMGAGGCTVFYVDADGDGFGNPATGLCLCQKTPFNTTAVGGDCNDDAATAHPGATEICDGLDNNCDGVTDEANAMGCTEFYVDGDNDGWGDSSKSACLCGANPTFKVAKAGDCNDANAAINPAAKEICDGVDNNCVNGIDEAGAQGCTTFWLDHDGDGFGALTDSQCLCAATGEYTATKSGDCNDNDKTINPKATEVCDGVDNDCDGLTDPQNSDGCTAWYVDKDGDNYGTFLLAPKCLCAGIPGYANVGGDCNDADPTVNPGATEICNGKDDNCDGVKDPKNSPGCVSYYVDLDNDMYGANGLSQCQCASDGVFSATLSGDCNDSNALINPGMTEICNGVDDNCDGQIDEGVKVTYYQDNDGDGYGSGITTQACSKPAGYVAVLNGDCNDANAAIHPGATEICNSLDDNCNGQTDEGLAFTTYYQDLDLDGYGNPAVSKSACSQPAGYVLDHTDCLDTNASVPGPTELCGPGNAPNGVDENCNGVTDEGCTVATCSGSAVIQDFTNNKGGHGWSLGSGWVDGGSSNAWGAAWALVYSNDPSSGYKAGGSASSKSLSVPAGFKFVQVDVSAFDNVQDSNCADGSCGPPSVADAGISLTVSLSTGGSGKLGPFSSSQYNAGAKTVKAPLPASWAGGSVTVTLTIAGAATYNTCYYAGIGVSKIEAVCN